MADTSTLDNVFAGARAALEKRGADVAILDVRRISGVTDYYLLVSGSSDRRVQAIGQAILETVGERGQRPLGVEGMAEGRWVLVDFGDWVAHIFYEELRAHYDLEGLWFDAPRVQLPPEVTAPSKSAAGGKP